jgi:hypothetical protein
MFPALPRNTVVQELRDDYNRFRADQERLGGLMPASLARLFLGISKQRLHQLMEERQIRFVIHDEARYISGADIMQRIADKKAGRIRTGRPSQNNS